LDNGVRRCLSRASLEHENTSEHQNPISLYILPIFIYTNFYRKKIYENGISHVPCVPSVENTEVLKQMKEADIVKAIMNYLKTVPGCFCWKEHGGMYGTAGIPDIIACINGRFFGFEVKTEGGKPTKLQASTIRKILAAGGTALVVHSVDEVRTAVDGFLR
jgi:hypothetical protein